VDDAAALCFFSDSSSLCFLRDAEAEAEGNGAVVISAGCSASLCSSSMSMETGARRKWRTESDRAKLVASVLRLDHEAGRHRHAWYGYGLEYSLVCGTYLRELYTAR
jgi:hypothetical protein